MNLIPTNGPLPISQNGVFVEPGFSKYLQTEIAKLIGTEKAKNLELKIVGALVQGESKREFLIAIAGMNYSHLEVLQAAVDHAGVKEVLDCGGIVLHIEPKSRKSLITQKESSTLGFQGIPPGYEQLAIDQACDKVFELIGNIG